jgi:hypothetical protein
MTARRLLLPLFLLVAFVPAQAERVLEAAAAQPGRATARVAAIQPAGPTDLVLIGRGHQAGFRAGMSCEVSRAGRTVAEIVLVDLRAHAAAGLITRLADPGEFIRPGDTVALKLSFR